MLIPFTTNAQIGAFPFIFSTNQITIYTFIFEFRRTRHFWGELNNLPLTGEVLGNLIEFIKITIRSVHVAVNSDFSFPVLYYFILLLITPLQQYTSGAELIIGNAFSEFRCDVAVLAFGDSVGIIVGEGLLLLARIEAEHVSGVALCCLLSERHRLVVRCGRELRLAHLNDRAPAVPAIGRSELFPERIGDGKRDTPRPATGTLFNTLNTSLP